MHFKSRRFFLFARSFPPERRGAARQDAHCCSQEQERLLRYGTPGRAGATSVYWHAKQDLESALGSVPRAVRGVARDRSALRLRSPVRYTRHRSDQPSWRPCILPRRDASGDISVVWGKDGTANKNSIKGEASSTNDSPCHVIAGPSKRQRGRPIPVVWLGMRLCFTAISLPRPTPLRFRILRFCFSCPRYPFAIHLWECIWFVERKGWSDPNDHIYAAQTKYILVVGHNNRLWPKYSWRMVNVNLRPDLTVVITLVGYAWCVLRLNSIWSLFRSPLWPPLSLFPVPCLPLNFPLLLRFYRNFSSKCQLVSILLYYFKSISSSSVILFSSYVFPYNWFLP